MCFRPHIISAGVQLQGIDQPCSCLLCCPKPPLLRVPGRGASLSALARLHAST